MTERYSKNCVVCGLKFGDAYRCPKCKCELDKPYLARREAQTKRGFVCQFCVAEGYASKQNNSKPYKTKSYDTPDLSK